MTSNFTDACFDRYHNSLHAKNNMCKIKLKQLSCSLLNARLVRYVEGENLISDVQNGFRKNRSCNQHIFALNEVLKMRLSEGRSTHLCFVDFRKAFDLRDLMLCRLAELGVGGKLYAAIRSAYEVTYNAVRLNGRCGRWFENNIGLKQGDTLSPVQFSTYVNGLI